MVALTKTEWMNFDIYRRFTHTDSWYLFFFVWTHLLWTYFFVLFFFFANSSDQRRKQTNKPKQCQLIIGSNCEHGEWYSTAIEKGKKNDLIEVELVFFSIIRDEWTHCGRYCLINSRFLPYSYVLPCSSHAKWLPSGSIWTLSSKCHVNVCLFNSNSMVVGQF